MTVGRARLIIPIEISSSTLKGGAVKPEIELHLVSLAEELQKILRENLIRDPSQTDAAMARARAIREEIESYGWTISWDVKIDLQNPEDIKVRIVLWKPKPNLSPEDQKLYDDWFTGRNNPAAR
ncbi:MAG: hypothetical protein A2745_03330 [Candidatus Harrisonbacteria bacterium RIFCSPHIGHO2_01_FULL_44_13]|uniref:Uncharacterized protein n=1 Tax=Candidatus Harrisonbacteria bacterium RIFCSPLOWO2_01_FULL_44_18 TaxID=1798407 RepID=A0A1G1ZRK5_9BACT|nr:MAG: hypothetical protein A2745_03330 [Candidatus Harrisonbacteria bacterium RIFCSPHIGHO2_01_FULL_44_13]OGY66390.1 MAG: hypothetical protein A3A16_03415 [Candidatus Harrisonbacteria bacterium RIFCSPLOWO2_01_FULL_44_18]